jgi:hypothetical protein
MQKNCENIIYLVIYDFLIIRCTLNVMSKSKKKCIHIETEVVKIETRR